MIECLAGSGSRAQEFGPFFLVTHRVLKKGVLFAHGLSTEWTRQIFTLLKDIKKLPFSLDMLIRILTLLNCIF